jgi:hypothetical protein
MKTQALGWLAAAVVAAGLNASYHDGGLEWAHQIADRVEHNAAAVVALATGRAGQFLAEARWVGARDETASCPWSTILAQAQTRVARTENRFAQIEVMSAREQAQLARLEANRARIEALVAARTARIRIPAVAVSPVSIPEVEIPAICPRVRVKVPRLPRIPAPVIHVQTLSEGPV